MNHNAGPMPGTVLPLSEFTESHRAEIEAKVAADSPPDKWIYLGPSDSPYPLAVIESRAWYEWHWARGIYPGTSRDPLPKHLREAVIARDGHVCQLCGGDVEPGDIHIDHIIPWSRGGKHELGNLQVAHSTCNLRKGAKVS